MVKIEEQLDKKDEYAIFINDKEVEIETAHIKITDSVKFETINFNYIIAEVITSANFVKEF